MEVSPFASSSSSQSASQNPSTEPALVNRLDQRRIAPVGVVNLEQFNTRAAQVPGWIVQRSTFLHELATRYSSDVNASESGTLVFASSRPVPPPIETPLPHASAPLMRAVSTQMPTATPVRVSRKPAPFLSVRSSVPTELPPQTSHNSLPSSPSQFDRQADINPSASLIEPQNPSVAHPQNRSASVESAAPDLSRTPTVNLPTVPLAIKQTPSVSLAPQSTPPLILPRRNPLPSISDSSTVSTTVSPRFNSIPPDGASPNVYSSVDSVTSTVSDSSTQASNQPLILAKTQSAQIHQKSFSEPLSARKKAIQPSVPSSILQNSPERMHLSVSPPVVKEIAVVAQSLQPTSQTLILPKRNPLAQQVANGSSAEKIIQTKNHPNKTGEMLQSNTVEHATSAYPTVPELPTSVMPSHTMVWRKPADLNSTHAPLQIQPTSTIARQTSQPSVVSPSESPLPAPTEVNPSTPTPNPAQLAEQVSRILHRQLTVERERRGLQSW